MRTRSSITIGQKKERQPVGAAPHQPDEPDQPQENAHRQWAVHGAAMLSRDDTTDVLPRNARSIRPQSNGKAGMSRLTSIRT